MPSTRAFTRVFAVAMVLIPSLVFAGAKPAAAAAPPALPDKPREADPLHLPAVGQFRIVYATRPQWSDASTVGFSLLRSGELRAAGSGPALRPTTEVDVRRVLASNRPELRRDGVFPFLLAVRGEDQVPVAALAKGLGHVVRPAMELGKDALLVYVCSTVLTTEAALPAIMGDGPRSQAPRLVAKDRYRILFAATPADGAQADLQLSVNALGELRDAQAIFTDARLDEALRKGPGQGNIFTSRLSVLEEEKTTVETLSKALGLVIRSADRSLVDGKSATIYIRSQALLDQIAAPR